MATYLTDGLYVWDVTLAGGETRRLLSNVSPHGFTMPVIAATRGAMYPPGPDPTVTTLTPPGATVGDPDLTLHVGGADFRDGDEILWNGQPVPTAYVSPTELTTPISMAGQVAGAIPVAVRPLAGLVSAAIPFTIA